MPMSFPETWTNPRDGSSLRLIPAGPFLMGSTQDEIEAAMRMHKDGPAFALLHETPQFEAWRPAFYISIYAVTNLQFARFLSAARPSTRRLESWVERLEHIALPTRTARSIRIDPGFDRHPVPNVTWFGAQAYCRWAGLRLPSEMEWEKAARGTDGRIFPWGDDWRPQALRWHEHRPSEETTAPVDAFPDGRSPYGLFQMAGNVEEWCGDWYRPEVYRRYAQGDLRPPVRGRGRVVRGGTCMRHTPLEFRCAMRRTSPPALINILYTGIRCACDAALVLEA